MIDADDFINKLHQKNIRRPFRIYDWDGTLFPACKYKSTWDVFKATLTKDMVCDKKTLLEVIKSLDCVIITARPGFSTFFIKLRIFLEIGEHLTLTEKMKLLFGDETVSTVNPEYFYSVTSKEFFKVPLNIVAMMKIGKAQSLLIAKGLTKCYNKILYIDEDMTCSMPII